jgi:hypothetical protein
MHGDILGSGKFKPVNKFSNNVSNTCVQTKHDAFGKVISQCEFYQRASFPMNDILFKDFSTSHGKSLKEQTKKKNQKHQLKQNNKPWF